MRRDESPLIEKLPKSITVNFDPRVLEWILSETNKHPNSEEGGKYIGHMDVAGEGGPGTINVTISDFLPGGPGAKRTAVEFLPDGKYQERLFREIDRLDPDVEHLGSWHTHHCNGLDKLSPGDEQGYFRTVNKKDYRPNVFIASLVKFIPRHPKSEPWIDHFLFVRGDENYYAITNEVRFLEADALSRRITGHDPARGRGGSNESSAIAPSSWSESEVGRKSLAADRDFLTRHFPGGFRATRKRSQIHIRCEDNGRVITIAYPVHRQDSDLKVAVLKESEVIVSMDCNVAHRMAAYAAAMTVLEHL
jgi:hypothetical protein